MTCTERCTRIDSVTYGGPQGQNTTQFFFQAQVVQWISIRETNCVIHWIVIYPVDSAIQLLNNWGQNKTIFFKTQMFLRTQKCFSEHKNLFQNTKLFFRTQQPFSEHNNLFQNTTIFSRTQQSFPEHNNVFQNTTRFMIHNGKLKHNKNW